MIGQYLLNTNKSATVSILKKKKRTKQGLIPCGRPSSIRKAPPAALKQVSNFKTKIIYIVALFYTLGVEYYSTPQIKTE